MQGNFWQNHSTTKPCSQVFGRPWKVTPDKHRVRGTKGDFVAGIQLSPPIDQAAYERRFEQVIGNSPALARAISQRPILPAECLPRAVAAVARALRRYSSVGGAFCRRL